MFIYKTTNLINRKYYIGKYAGKRSTYLGSGVALKKAIAKYGRKNFKREIIEHCSSLHELSEREKFYIDLFDAVNDPRSYNLTEGGQGNFSHIVPVHYEKSLDKKYGKELIPPPGAVFSKYIQEYVITVGGKISVLSGVENVAKFLGMERSQVYKYLGIVTPKKGYKHNSLQVDTYTDQFYLIEGTRYTSTQEVQEKYDVSIGTIHHRCLKSKRMDWWKIVEIKDKWKEL